MLFVVVLILLLLRPLNRTGYQLYWTRNQNHVSLVRVRKHATATIVDAVHEGRIVMQTVMPHLLVS